MIHPEEHEATFSLIKSLYTGLERRGYVIMLTEDPKRDLVIGPELLDDDRSSNWFIEYAPFFQLTDQLVTEPARLGVALTVGRVNRVLCLLVPGLPGKFTYLDDDVKPQAFPVHWLDSCFDYLEQYYSARTWTGKDTEVPVVQLEASA